ncbi:hypothetical protein [Paenibacillus oceani]|uniref:Uncharacterized protein n=1 Tax=Paenibacillus oceani TaxID=2772510 RepID=A0A927C8R2_9BACL|nr:hypothetical protein [Paenibacillus oceani]MBD2862122.1 hypothetical protein [Paenibacillus oceani]
MPMPTSAEMSILFEENDLQLRQFIAEHKMTLKRRGISEEDWTERSGEPIRDQIVQAFAIIYGVAVDWREFDEDIVLLFGKMIPEQVEVENTDEGLNVVYDGRSYSIPLSFSPKDRYITIRGFQSIVRDRYEVRLLEASYLSDTHEFVILPVTTWEELERSYPGKIGEVFRTIDDDLDFP